MPVLSKRTVLEVSREYRRRHGLRAGVLDLDGRVAGADALNALARVRRQRRYALHESLNWGDACVFRIGHSVTSWIVAMEDRRIVHGGLAGGEVLTDRDPDNIERNERQFAALGMGPDAARAYVASLPVWNATRIHRASTDLRNLFYQVSGWKPLAMEENRLRVQQQQQLAEAIEDRKRRGDSTAYPFEKERELLSRIRAGDTRGARHVLNETLAAMYMTSPELVVLRARAIEMMGYLTRAAVEDSPLLESVIERNHQWMRRLILAADFEELSRVLTEALDDFIETIYLQGFNRSNAKVSRALEFLSANYTKPVSLREVAAHAELSPFRLAHLVKRHTGHTVVQLLHQIRARHARQLLENTSKTCTEIAYEVGYGDQSYFIRHFRRAAGVTPARYRRARLAARGEPTM